MIDFCLGRGIPRISMSGTTYATKLLIGGRLEQRWILFRFQNGVVNTVLPWLAPAFDFESNDPELQNLHDLAGASRVSRVSRSPWSE